MSTQIERVGGDLIVSRVFDASRASFDKLARHVAK